MLSSHFEVKEHAGDRKLSREELIKAVIEYDGILSMFFDSFDKEILKNREKVQAISNYAIGLDNIDVEYAKSLGIAIYNLPDIVTNSTADLAFAIFLSLIRKIVPSSFFVRQNLFKTLDPLLFLGEELQGKYFGIVGWGRTGQAMAKRALGFGLNVIFYHYKDIEIAEEFKDKVQAVTWEEILKKSDYLSFHVPLTPKTRNMVDLGAFQKMEKHPILINVARGAVFNTVALVQALKKGLIRGCALDVTDPEPLPQNHPLLFFENCLITPHIGTATVECRYNMAIKSAEQLIKHFKT